MRVGSDSVMSIFSGWDGYQNSLLAAISPLSPEQLRYRCAPEQSCVGEIAAHIAFGRLDWFHRMGAEGCEVLVAQAEPHWRPWGKIDSAIHDDPALISRWLEVTWKMIESNLTRWSVDDLNWTYRQPYAGKTYLVSRQWVIWRVMSHDLHHGGQLSLLLDMQGVSIPDLGDNGGHSIEPEIAPD